MCPSITASTPGNVLPGGATVNPLRFSDRSTFQAYPKIADIMRVRAACSFDNLMHPTTTTPARTEFSPPRNLAPARARGQAPLFRMTVKIADVYTSIQFLNKQLPTISTAKPSNVENEQRDRVDVRSDEILHRRYRVISRLGNGTFGEVFRCYDIQRHVEVAVKVDKGVAPHQTKAESRILRELNEGDEDQEYGIVRMLDRFVHRGKRCIVFELLSTDLYTLIRRSKSLSLPLVRKMAYQLLCALEYLAMPDVDIIHCDLKPENILLQKANESRIKIIDFGTSCRSHEQVYTYIQSRYYRAPEVLLGLDYTQAIDMWSLGCILMELHTGQALFPGKDACDLMRRFIEFQGLPPSSMTDKSCWTEQFFETMPDGSMILRSHPDAMYRPECSLRETIRQSKNVNRWVKTPGHSTEHYDCFLDLIQGMLSFDPEKRMTPEEALNHPFFTADSPCCHGNCTCTVAPPGMKRARSFTVKENHASSPKKIRRFRAPM